MPFFGASDPTPDSGPLFTFWRKVEERQEAEADYRSGSCQWPVASFESTVVSLQSIANATRIASDHVQVDHALSWRRVVTGRSVVSVTIFSAHELNSNVEATSCRVGQVDDFISRKRSELC